MTRTMAEQLQGNQPDVRRRRLLFQSQHRGTQEGDLILGSFAETFLTTFDNNQLDRFEALLDCSDADLFDWIFSGNAPPEHDHDVMQLLRAFRVRPHGRHYQHRQFSTAPTTQE